MSTTESYKKSRRVREITVTLDYTDTTSAEMFKLPKGVRWVDAQVKVKTAFSGGTTTLDVGTATDSDHYVDGLTLAAAGAVALGTAITTNAIGTTTTEITPIYMNVGAGNTAGEVVVTFMFSQVVDRRF